MRISDWSSDVCSSDLGLLALAGTAPALAARRRQRARRTPLAQPLPAAPVRGRDAGDVGVGLARVRAGTGAVGTAGRRGDAVSALVQAVAACRVRDVRRGAAGAAVVAGLRGGHPVDRKSTRLNSS